MGTYDSFVDGKREGQVKMFECCLHDYKIGDKVPDCNDCHNFSIAMREGGFVNVRDNVFESWTDEPLYHRVYDKYGMPWSEESQGIMGEHYFFKDITDKDFDRFKR
jgi:hypothetical protein